MAFCVMQGRYIVGPNLPTDPSQSTRICDAQNPDSSGSSEPADPCQNSVWSHCMDKVSSKLAVGNNERSFFGVDRLGDIGSSSEPESTLALPRFTEQLSLDGEHSYSAEKLPSCSQNENFEEPAVFGSTRAVYGRDNLIDHPLQLQFEEHGLLLDLDIGMQDDIFFVTVMQDDMKSLLLLPSSGYSFVNSSDFFFYSYMKC